MIVNFVKGISNFQIKYIYVIQRFSTNEESLGLVATELHRLDSAMLFKISYLSIVNIAPFSMTIQIVLAQKSFAEFAFHREKQTKIASLCIFTNNNRVAENKSSFHIIAVWKNYELF